jgi:hypothetical protein
MGQVISLQLLVTTHELLSRLDSREEVYIAILDFSKAVDVVSNERLHRKLSIYGIEGKCLVWMMERTQIVLVDGVTSHSDSRTNGNVV